MFSAFGRLVYKCVNAVVGVNLTEQDKKNIQALQNRKGPEEAVREYWRKAEQGKQKVPGVAKNLKPGDLSNNQDWMYIQDIGQYISPCGNDRKHTVIVQEVRRHTVGVEIARIECTNSIYSEWIVACSNSMWHTQAKTAQDIHGNFYHLGQMCQTRCTVTY